MKKIKNFTIVYELNYYLSKKSKFLSYKYKYGQFVKIDSTPWT